MSLAWKRVNDGGPAVPMVQQLVELPPGRLEDVFGPASDDAGDKETGTFVFGSGSKRVVVSDYQPEAEQSTARRSGRR